jgi:hypothetical protein
MLIARVRKFAAISLASSLVLVALPAFSASIAGTKCAKAGITKTSANVKYTCVKQGSKLVWNKSVTMKPTAKLAPTSLATPSPSTLPKFDEETIKIGEPCTSDYRGKTVVNSKGAFICKHDDISAFRWFSTEPPKPVEAPKPTPTATPTPQAKGANGYKYYGNVYEELKKYLSPDYSTLRITFHISDEAKKRPIQTYLDSVALGARLWYQDFNNTDVNIILFTEKDGEWIDQKQSQLMGNWQLLPEQLQSNRMKIYGCHVGGFYFPNIVLGCVNPEMHADDLFAASMMFVHEFAHLSVFTSKQLSSTPIGDKSRFRPAWVEEGGGTFFGNFGAYVLDPTFAADRENFYDLMQTTVNRKSREDVINMYKTLESTNYGDKTVQDAYFLGSIGFEYLAKEYGVQKIFDANRLFFKGNTWAYAFQTTYGISLDTFYSKMADIVVTDGWKGN